MDNETLSLDEKLQQLNSKQSLSRGIVVGLIAAIVAAAIWAAITYFTEKMYALVAIGVGGIVGLGVRFGGKGVEKDFDKAIDLFETSAEKGIAVAQYMMGWCCEHGQGARENYYDAIEWYKLAADQGNGEAIEGIKRCNRTIIELRRMNAENRVKRCQQEMEDARWRLENVEDEVAPYRNELELTEEQFRGQDDSLSFYYIRNARANYENAIREAINAHTQEIRDAEIEYRYALEELRDCE